jgi:uncharacterized membrane protein YkoI
VERFSRERAKPWERTTEGRTEGKKLDARRASPLVSQAQGAVGGGPAARSALGSASAGSQPCVSRPMRNAESMKLLAAVILLALALPAALPARADSDDQNRAREAYERHEILPLAEILAKVKQTYRGNVVNIEYEEQGKRHIYEFEIVNPKGQVIEVQVDAATGKVIGDEGGEN